jgi:AcrR family transcriptional regulator
VSETPDRRARKKAQTREHVRATAQRLFAERGFEAVTIADVAAAADVAVQTVFNHFATKEELFSSGRTPWRQGAAEAVRGRAAGTGPLAALRAHLVRRVGDYVREVGSPAHRQLVATLKASPALLAHERLLQQEAEEHLRVALLEAWERPGDRTDEFVPTDHRLAAAVIATVWPGAIRALLLQYREAPPAPGDSAAVENAVRTAELLLDRVERILEPLPGDVVVRRAS